MKHTYIVAAIVVALSAVGYWYWESLSGNGSTYENAGSDMIKLDLIRPDHLVLPVFTATGEARGPWYFEGSFPAEVLNAEGAVIATVPATAITDWMTEEFVPFRVSFDLGEYSGPATLVLKKDNPSGLPENDASLRVPIEVFDVE